MNIDTSIKTQSNQANGLTVENMSVKYGDHLVVDRFNVTLASDEILMLVGPTGCGKTTILHALAGLVPITDGQIKMNHWTASSHKQTPPEKRHVGMVFQDFALFPHLSVEDNVGFRLKDRSRADHWIELLGLNKLRKAKPGRLSGGQKQRVALARTLAHQPDFVLLDEPLSSLDAAMKDSLRWEIRQALKAAKVPAIWVTHDQDEALSIGDRVGVLKDGKLEQLSTPEQCFDQPNTRFVAEFLGEAAFVSAQFNDGFARTEFGMAPIQSHYDLKQGDVLFRPDDLKVTGVTEGGNGKILWQRYEGESRLYAVTTDQGQVLKIRSSHEKVLAIGDRVLVTVATQHPLAAFEH